MHDIVTKRIEQFTGITADKVCIASNHAHWGAPISDSPEIGCYADENYKDVFFRLVADAVIIAYKRLDDATVKFGNSIAPGLAFCRNFELEDGTYVCHGRNRPNIKRALAEPDEELPVLLFEKDGKPIGAVICYACHQCTVGKANGVTGYSGDYASVMSEILKERYGHDFVSLFLIGTCGDVNHVNPDVNEPVTNFKIIGEKLADYYENSKDAAVPLTEGGVKSVKEFIDIKRRDPSLEANKDIYCIYLSIKLLFCMSAIRFKYQKLASVTTGGGGGVGGVGGVGGTTPENRSKYRAAISSLGV